MAHISFTNADGDFSLSQPEENSYLYFPIAGEAGLKCSVTPNLGGDSKLDQEGFLLEPVSSENLHNNRSTRNFWLITEKGCWSAAGASARQEAERFTPQQDQSSMTAGLMWHSTRRERDGLLAEITSFVPVQKNVEVMQVRITNISTEDKSFTPVAAIPIYGRSADNIRDHRNVTSMLHRIQVTENGVLVKPTMSFDEKGHRRNHRIYYVVGTDGAGHAPVGFYPTVDCLLGEGGTFTQPRAILENRPALPTGTAIDGREAVGGLRFAPCTLGAGASTEYILLLGITEDASEIDEMLNVLATSEKADAALEAVKTYWQNQVNVRYHTGNSDFDNLMRWISFQPFLRRLYGCSFLPHHDYGRGGRGWRDLWQDCLSLLLMEPGAVREMIAANFGGVRMDGTNATIIGSGLGNFIADRNGIARVWMDHALWPLMTTKLYIDQTGDIQVLKENVGYFKDPQCMRGTEMDALWQPRQGNVQRTESGTVYQGSLTEHLLIQHLTAFLEVGEHNILKLRGADWNDALDMASHRGESVAFTCAYAGNLMDLAALLRILARQTGDEIRLAQEIEILLRECSYDSIAQKTDLLNAYTSACRHSISGVQKNFSLNALADALEERAQWLFAHLRKQEWLDAGWFNSYYDDSGNAVEGIRETGVRMMLTGQVFAIMSGTATEEQIRSITANADKYLCRPEIGGYRLNTDFKELKFDMGRMFGFAYGEKENGAVFSHMTVMYANALYRRGFVQEGHRALQLLADAALNFPVSRMYPGIPEYFNADGRGVYQYLTGAGSWYMMTVITQAFGVRGELGNLVLEPKLTAEQFDADGKASICLTFAGQPLEIVFDNPKHLTSGEYQIVSVTVDGEERPVAASRTVLSRSSLSSIKETITVTLG